MDLDESGFVELQRKLTRLADKGGREASKKGMRAAVRVRAKKVRELAPVKRVDDPMFVKTALPPGAMKADIHTRVSDGEGIDDVDGIVFPGKDTAHVQYFVETGHRLVRGGYSRVLDDGTTRGPGRQVGFIEKKPFWRPAEDTTEEEAVQAYMDAATAEIDKVLSEE